MDDVQFTFDTLPFMNGIDKITKGMRAFGGVAVSMANAAGGALSSMLGLFINQTKKTGEEAEKAAKGAGSGMTTWAIAKGMMLANIVMGLVKKAFNFIKSGLPELSKTFSIAGDIFQRNFLWPLRKELTPYLQKVLDWARDSRGMFVRWGGYLVNVFRIVKNQVVMIIESIKVFLKGFSEIWEGAFGKTTKTFSDFMNILVFKIAGTLIFLQSLLQPAFEAVGRAIAFLAVGVKEFFSGIATGASDIAAPIADIIQMFTDLVNWIFGSTEAAKGFGIIMRGIGDFLGTTFVNVLDAIVISVRTLVDALKMAYYLIKGILQAMTGDLKGASESGKALLRVGSDWADYTKTRMNRIGKRSGEYNERNRERVSEFMDATGIESPYAKARRVAPGAASAKIDQSKNVNQKMEIKVDRIIVESKTDDPMLVGREVGRSLENSLRGNILNSMTMFGGVPLGSY